MTTRDADDRALWINRELSWLAFNERVLDQAADPSWPLLERVKFLAIFGSNLDEFFMIRVSGLHEQLESTGVLAGPDGATPREQLARIREVVQRLVGTATSLVGELVTALSQAGIRIRTWQDLEPEKRASARTYFREGVFPLLTPLAVDPVHPFPFLSNLSLSLAVEAEDPTTGARRFARVKVPETLPRFVEIGAGADGSVDLVPLEELIAANLADLFPGMTLVGVYPFRVTRDMDIDILEDEADDLLAVVDREIQRRRFGAAVRLEVAPDVPPRVRALLLEKLQIDDDDAYESPGPLGLSALMGIAARPRPDLHDPPIPPRPLPRWGAQPFATIAAGDVLVHHPYDPFTSVLDFLRHAAEDPGVLAIKMTLYRAGSNSEAVRALVRAAEAGKQVAVSIELKARFDEENNIGWARALERAGVHVFYGAQGLKTHAKVLLVVRREGAKLRRYVHLSTGNYNASTAKLYTDFGLFTADEAIGEDASELFNALSGFARTSSYRKLAVAPVSLRRTILAKIDEQTARAEAKRPSRIFAKVNALVDQEVGRALYRASQAGVPIELVVRGVCCVRPGVPGVSDNIRVLSVIGRFLEHERVFVFGTPGEGEHAGEEMFLASADWMPRNLDRRVETLFPVASESLREQIRNECIAPLALDNCRTYEMGPDGVYQRRRPAAGEASHDAQILASCSKARAAARPATNGTAGKKSHSASTAKKHFVAEP
jgi:polyphosphate kinase